MKVLAAVIIGSSLMLATVPTLAGGRDHRGGHYRSHDSYHNSYGRHYRRAYDYPYYRHRGRHHRHHHSNDAAYLIGGLALGAILTSTYYSTPRYARTDYYPSRPSRPSRRIVSYPTERVVVRQSLTPGRHLLRDLDGRCWEKRRNDRGEELRVELPAEDCDW